MAYEWEAEEARDALRASTESERASGCSHDYQPSRRHHMLVCTHCGDTVDP